MGLKFGARRYRYREGHFLASRVRGIRLLPRERDNKGRYNYLAFPWSRYKRELSTWTLHHRNACFFFFSPSLFLRRGRVRRIYYVVVDIVDLERRGIPWGWYRSIWRFRITTRLKCLKIVEVYKDFE